MAGAEHPVSPRRRTPALRPGFVLALFGLLFVAGVAAVLLRAPYYVAALLLVLLLALRFAYAASRRAERRRRSPRAGPAPGSGRDAEGRDGRPPARVEHLQEPAPRPARLFGWGALARSGRPAGIETAARARGVRPPGWVSVRPPGSGPDLPGRGDPGEPGMPEPQGVRPSGWVGIGSRPSRARVAGDAGVDEAPSGRPEPRAAADRKSERR